VGWISNDGGDAAVVAGGEVVALKPLTRLYATQTWAQRRNLHLPAEPEAAVNALFDCDHSACAPHAFTRPAIAAWWTKREPKPDRLAQLCERADILILRADADLPAACDGVRVLRRASFARGGAAEIYPAPGGWRLVWSQPLRGVRPWTLSDSAG
jgi:competence protein ComEC